MPLRGGGQVFVIKVKAGAQRVLTEAARSHIALGTHYGFQYGAGRGFYQLSDLPANPFEWQAAAGREALDLGSASQNDNRSAGQYLVVVARLPLVIDFVQLQNVMVGQHPNLGVQGLVVAKRWRVNPAAFGVEQAAVGQFDPGQGLCPGLVKQMHQRRGKGCGQLGLSCGFLGVESQLQDPAIIPVAPALQVFQQTTGVAKAADDHLRQSRTVCRELEVQNALRVARRFLGQSFVALQQYHRPAAAGQAIGAGATRQAATDDQCCTRAFDPGRAGKPGFDCGCC